MNTSGAGHSRLFVSLPVPDEVRREMANAQEEFRRALLSDQFRWSNSDQFHVTLRFLGNVANPAIPDLISALRRAVAAFPSMEMAAGRVGCFPNPRRPRVLWFGVADASGSLPTLHQQVQSASQPFTDEEPDSRFSGHITFARIRGFDRTIIEKLARLLAANEDAMFGSWTASHLHLMQSHLSPKGAKHELLQQIDLAAPDKRA